ncbi:DUF7673 family protein [Aliiruegeria sabulilitoris]|uniref:DUF7673 family protein n=1 Tax=Aliiruegeria sabulilitoris TaxID=1510458 RepID=UPI0008362BA4|nr:hypothetical protein [Aliiruegeria sabulilitoris]NDR56311.1 hypothetical protein [Pseudoruegeria sp. M32A2M]
MNPETSSAIFKFTFLRTIVDFAHEHHYDDLRISERIELLSDGANIAAAHSAAIARTAERAHELAQRAAYARIELAESDSDPAASEIIRYVNALNQQTPFCFREPRNSLGIEPIKVNRQTLEESFARLYSLATEHSTPSSAAARDLLLAAFNSSTNKFDFHDLKRLDRSNKLAALKILIANVLEDFEADKVLTRSQIDRLLSARHSDATSEAPDPGALKTTTV